MPVSIISLQLYHLRHHFYWCHRFYACLMWMMEKRNRDRGGEDIRTFSRAFLGLTYLIRFGHIHSRRFPPFPQGRHRRWQRESCPYVPIWLVSFLHLSPRRYYCRLASPFLTRSYLLLCCFYILLNFTVWLNKNWNSKNLGHTSWNLQMNKEIQCNEIHQ